MTGQSDRVISERAVWKGIGVLSGLAVGYVVRLGLQQVWRASTGKEPPGNPVARNTTWRQALIWAISSGAAMAVARLLTQRGAAEAFKMASGHYPEGLEEVRA